MKPPVSWISLWKRIQANGDGTGAYLELERAYADPPRAYHNLSHVLHCLDEFSGAKTLAEEPDAVESALWFHDAIYDPRAKDNEEKSAKLANEVLAAAGVSTTFTGRVEALIMATQHHHAPDAPDSNLVLDVDLSILGAPEDVFQAFEAAIREEYAWVPEDRYRQGRARIMQSFVDRPRIYGTDHFADKYEAAARRNLEDLISELRT